MKLAEQYLKNTTTKTLNEGLSVNVRISPSVILVYEAHITSSNRGVKAEIKTFISLKGNRPFENDAYKTIVSAFFSEGETERNREFTDEVYETEYPARDAKRWAEQKIKDYKKL